MSATPVFSQTTSMQHLQGDSHAAQTLVLQITLAPVHRHTSQTSFSQHLQCDSTPARTNTMEITMAVTHRTAGGPAATTRAGGPSAVSGHCGDSRPSGDHARRSLWTLRREPAQRRPRAPQALLQSLDTAERAGPAATTRAAGPSAVSGHCGLLRRRPCCSLWTLRREPAQRRPRAPQTLLQSLVSGHCGESRPSGDHARRRPFCSLWTLRPSATEALLQSLDTAETAGPAATTRAADPSAVSGHCGESRPSGDHARRRPFCSLWTLRPSAPQALLQSLDTAERAGPAATTRAAGPAAVSGHCGESRPSGDHARRRPFCSLWTLRREPAQAPQALLQSLDTAERAGPAATTRAAGPSAVSGHCGESRPSGDHARRRPFCSLWTLQALLQSRQ